MDGLEKFNETKLREREDFYSHLNMEDITDADYRHTKGVCKDLQIKYFGEYHDLYVQRDTLLLADLFENFQKMYLENYQLDPARLVTAPGSTLQADLKKDKVKLDLLTGIDMLLIVEKVIRSVIGHAFHQYAEANNKYMKYYDEDKEFCIFVICMDGQCLRS